MNTMCVNLRKVSARGERDFRITKSVLAISRETLSGCVVWLCVGGALMNLREASSGARSVSRPKILLTMPGRVEGPGGRGTLFFLLLPRRRKKNSGKSVPL